MKPSFEWLLLPHSLLLAPSCLANMIMSPSQPLVIPGNHDVFQNFSQKSHISTNPKSLILASAWIRSAPSRSPEFLRVLTVIRSKDIQSFAHRSDRRELGGALVPRSPVLNGGSLRSGSLETNWIPAAQCQASSSSSIVIRSQPLAFPLGWALKPLSALPPRVMPITASKDSSQARLCQICEASLVGQKLCSQGIPASSMWQDLAD